MKNLQNKKQTGITFDEMMQRENPGSFSEEMVEYFRELHNSQSEE